MAHAFIDAIAKAGADAVKFQTHIAEAESSPEEPWRVKFSPQDETRFGYWKRMEFTEDQWRGLSDHARDRGMVFLSSPFSDEAVAMLERLDMAAWKIASGEVNNPMLMDRILATGKPVLLSSGMSPVAEVDAVVSKLKARSYPYAVLQCTSRYPTPPEKIGLNLLGEYRERYACPVGLSDHSGTIYPGLAATALGADLLEIHVAFSREMFGPDVAASVTTGELAQLVEGIRFVEKALANPVDKEEAAKEFAAMRQIFTKSLFAAEDLPAGTRIERRHLTARKPGTGISVEHVDEIVGRSIQTAIPRGQMLKADDLSPPYTAAG
ncbi:MAG TPA: N-acetylneuraminate synthase family protein [Rhizomicrobium sp.]|nr:N-acetylneuraminate synthase family protein [Rhizomicrobium sp.]